MRKTKLRRSYKNLKGNNAERKLRTFLNRHEQYRNSFWLRPPATASGRRAMQFEDYFCFTFGDNFYEFEQSLTCTCGNIYWKSTVHVNKQKKNIRIVKQLLEVA